jgi:hypothetical protein
MSQDAKNELGQKTKQLLDGPLKHVRGAALAAALLPLASVAAAPASAQTCASGGVCGTVFNDANNNGVQDAGDTPYSGAVVVVSGVDGSGTPFSTTLATNSGGVFQLVVDSGATYTIAVQIPSGTTPSPADVGDDETDSDGHTDGLGNSVATVFLDGTNGDVDFGFVTSAVQAPGTGTPGYWKTHPEAWPVTSISVGGVSYSREQAINWLDNVGKDKTTTMFSSLVSAKLNLLVGNDGSCVSSTIDKADAWMATYGPVGHGVAASSYAWKVGEPLHRQMDNYNNGMLCAPHRN